MHYIGQYGTPPSNTRDRKKKKNEILAKTQTSQKEKHSSQALVSSLLIRCVIAPYLIRLASFDFALPPFPLPLPSLVSSSFPNLPRSRWVRPVAHRLCVPALQYRLIVELA